MNNTDTFHEENLSLIEIVIFLWKKRVLIVSITLISSIFAITYSLSLPDIYKSEAILSPVDEQSSPIPKLGGIASLAGINMTQSSTSKSQEAIQLLKSFYFFSLYEKNTDIMPFLMASKNWNPLTNEVQFNESIYDINSSKWTREAEFPKQSKPSQQEAYKEFKKIFNVSQDIDSSFIFLSVKHVSPHVAKKMVDDIVKLLNELMRDKDRDEAIRSLNFLNSQIANTSLTEMRLALADLIRQETQTLMLVEANEDYVFKMIDPPIASEIKSEPNRAYLCILYTFLGFMISIFLCLILFYKQSNHRT
jgi:uncharacterized protein involved in exopolysaccharide biosynthesis